MEFTPSLELSRMLYEEEVAPLMAERFPGVEHAAGTWGMCSEVLGLDDEVSRDHEWGPRVTLVLTDADHARHAQDIDATFRASFPPQFKGLDMMWRRPRVDVHDTRERALYHVRAITLNDALQFCGGQDALPLQPVDWLRVSEQHLLEFTSGVIYRDDTGELTGARELLATYPDDVLRFLLAAEWNAVGGDWFPIGRMGSRRDGLGLRVQTAQITRQFMRIAFMVSRRYMPYKKWFGTLFKALPIAEVLEPMLLGLLREGDWQRAEERIGEAARLLLEQQNQLGLGHEIALDAETVDDGRHHVKYAFWDIGEQLTAGIDPTLKAIMDGQVFLFHRRTQILWNGEVGKWALLLQK